jgi:hypothetical protein
MLRGNRQVEAYANESPDLKEVQASGFVGLDWLESARTPLQSPVQCIALHPPKKKWGIFGLNDNVSSFRYSAGFTPSVVRIHSCPLRRCSRSASAFGRSSLRFKHRATSVLQAGQEPAVAALARV